METRMVENRLRSLPSFTILEVTIVVAILSVIVTIITITLNRFNEQLKVNRDIQQELNNWMLVRSNFWNEYYLSDSIALANQTLVFSQPHRSICYKSEDGMLIRKEQKNMDFQGTSESDEWRAMNVEIASIKEELSGNKKIIILSFPLKGEEMHLRFLSQKDNADQVNKYYQKLQND